MYTWLCIQYKIGIITLTITLGVQHILCCVFALFVFVLCALCCQCLCIIHFWLPFRYSPTFISVHVSEESNCLYMFMCTIYIRCNSPNPSKWCPTHIVLCLCVVLSSSCVPYVANFSALSIIDFPFRYSLAFICIYLAVLSTWFCKLQQEARIVHSLLSNVVLRSWHRFL